MQMAGPVGKFEGLVKEKTKIIAMAINMVTINENWSKFKFISIGNT